MSPVVISPEDTTRSPITAGKNVLPVVELLHPHVGPAIWAEDPQCAMLAWLGAIVQVLAHPIAIALWVARRRRAQRVDRPHTF